MTDPVMPAGTQDNPYAAPEHQPEAQRKVYSLSQVIWGTFIAGVFVTAFMARNNHLAFRQHRRAVITCWIFIGIGLVLIASGFFLPTTNFLVDIAIYLITAFAAGVWYNQTMRRSFDEHLRAGGRQASHWQAVGVIVLCLVTVIAFSAMVFAACEIAGIEIPE